VEPLAQRAVAQGRDVREHAGGQGAALRLRRRRAARAGRARRPGLPHRRVADRAAAGEAASSYTAALLADPPKAGEKVTEEAEEVVRAAREESEERVAEEAADVLYHLAVLLRSRGLALADAEKVLLGRRR
jgi:phosphoribosyl-ATP pyrophosphohydrolase/phosphoribosyl-AMP cyclohydrolase